MSSLKMSEQYEQIFGMPCSEEDLRTVGKILRQPESIDLNKRLLDDNTTLLHRACHNGNTALVKLLLHYGADIRLRDLWANTALHYASSKRSYDIVGLLLGADRHEVKHDGAKSKINTSHALHTIRTETTVVGSSDCRFDKENFINTANFRFRTALDLARESQHVDVAQFLIESGAGSGDLLSACHCLQFDEAQTIIRDSATLGADVKITSVYGLTSLHYSTCSIKTVQLLCSNGADPKITDEDGNTPLHFLVECEDSKDVIKTLVNQGANVNARNHQGKIPLHHACIRLQPRVIECLLHAGANSNAQDNSGATPLHYLVLYQKLDTDHYTISNLQEVMKKIQERIVHEVNFKQLEKLSVFKVHLKDSAKVTGFSVKGYSKYIKNKQNEWDYLVCRALAVNWDKLPNDIVNPFEPDSKEHHDITKLLLRHTNSTNVKDTFDRTALHIAATNGYVEIAKFLIEQYQADINIQDMFGTNALHEAVSNGHPNMVKLLLCESKKSQDKDGLINSQEYYRGETVLHKAVQCDNAEIMKEVLSHGPVVNIADFAGNTPLYAAVTGERSASASKLLSAGADMNVRNVFGNTLLHKAVAQNTSDKDSLLEIVKSLIRPNTAYGVDVNLKNYVGRTALHFAVWKNNTAMIDELCKSGATVNIADDYGNTPLHVMNSISVDGMKILIGRGADMNVRNSEGMTPLHVACLTRRMLIISILLKSGAACNAVDGSGASPLHYACCLHNRFATTDPSVDPLVDKLLNYGADCNIPLKVTGSTPLNVAGKQQQLNSLLVYQLVANVRTTGGSSAVDVLGNSMSHCLSSFDYAEFIPPAAQEYVVDFPRNLCGLTWLHLNAKAGLNCWSNRIYAPFVATPDNLGRSALHLALSCGWHLDSSFCGSYDLCRRTDFLDRNCFHHMCIAHNYHVELSKSYLKLVRCYPELIKARDIYGRTPLFYASVYQSEQFMKNLIAAGADRDVVVPASTESADSVPSMTMDTVNSSADDADDTHDRDDRDVSDDTDSRRTPNAFARPSDIFTVWKNIQLWTSNITIAKEQATEFVNRIMNKVAELDPLFTSTPTLVGSSIEGTRADTTHDEYDFMIILDNFASLLDYCNPHDYFPTYVRLKSSDDQMSQDVYQNYTDAAGVVQPIFVKERLYALLIQACYSEDVWRNSPFEYLRTKIKNIRQSPAVAFGLSLCHFSGSEQQRHPDRYSYVSIDIVPVVPTNWKLTENTDFDKYVKEHIPEIVDRRGFAVLKPHKYSVGNDTNGYCPVTFIYLESEVIRQLPTVKAAYTMMKWLLFCRQDEVGINKYALKICVIHCVVQERFRQESLHDVTEENLIHCIQMILQQLWAYVQNDAVHDVVMPEYDQPVWKFEPFAVFMKAYLSFFGMLYASDLYDDHEALDDPWHPLHVILSDMYPDVMQRKKAKLVDEFRQSFRDLQTICELFAVEATSVHEKHVGEVLLGISEERRRKLAHYAIRYSDLGNEFDLNQNTKTLHISSPHLMTTSWAKQF